MFVSGLAVSAGQVSNPRRVGGFWTYLDVINLIWLEYFHGVMLIPEPGFL